MMISVPAMATFQSADRRSVPGIELLELHHRGAVVLGSVVTSSGHRYWFHAHTNMMVPSAAMLVARQRQQDIR